MAYASSGACPNKLFMLEVNRGVDVRVSLLDVERAARASDRRPCRGHLARSCDAFP